jgi:hypothetical protein
VSVRLAHRLIGTFVAITTTALIMGSSAWAHHIPGATYLGTYSAGGTVKFTVSADGESVTGYQTGSAPTPIPGTAGGPFTCTVDGGSAVFVEEPILTKVAIDHEFWFLTPGGTSFKGKFGSRQAASGAYRIYAGGGACVTPEMTWSARTTASPARSEECRTAKRRVRKAKKAVRKATDARSKAKAKKTLRRARKRQKRVC